MSKNINTNNVRAIINEAGELVITLPFLAEPRLTKNEKNYVVCESGTWPNSWATVEIDGTSVGINVSALVKNMEHPDNQPKKVVTVPKFFTKKVAAGNGQSAPTVTRFMPGKAKAA